MSLNNRSFKVTNTIKQEPIGRQPLYHGLYHGIVKQVMDSSGTGKLRVWVAEMGGSEGLESSWVTVSYCSPFFGATTVTNNKDQDTYESTQTSYGMWFVPPDIGNMVIVGFVGGSKNNGYWLGVVPHMYANRMVPSVAAGSAHTNAGKDDIIQVDVPQAEYNKLRNNNPRQRGTDEADDSAFLRPYAKYHADGLVRQGLIEDQIRGVTTASARRSPVSNVYGISTPGPRIDNTSRRKGGSSLEFDDQEGSEKIRLRTRSGSQMLLDETNGIVYMINRDGTAWFEMDANGNVDIFAAGSITLRSESDVNIRADRDITLEAGRDIYMKAAKDFNEPGKHPLEEESGAGGNIYIEARNDALVLVKNNTQITNEVGNLDLSVAGTSILDTATLGIKSSNFNVETSGNTQVSGILVATGEMFAPNFKAPGIGLVGHTHVQGNGNDLGGGGVTQPGTNDGGSGSAIGPAALAVNKVSTVEKTNVEYQDLGLVYNSPGNNIKKAVSVLLNKARESTVTTLIKRWLTREPCPEKKKN